MVIGPVLQISYYYDSLCRIRRKQANVLAGRQEITVVTQDDRVNHGGTTRSGQVSQCRRYNVSQMQHKPMGSHHLIINRLLE